ncbi:MAG: L-rhamnose mutarotase [Verrucomicrobia bacterium]|nr:L-rhamnose mutarotase [Verrucomicrobiota bacterium]MDA1085840.1 L-rhamnose mutarotase [Verrucomicrobiota bacterium]
MIRRAFLMHVNPDQHEEYEKRHSPVWADLLAVLKDHGASNYSIFLDKEQNLLFGYVELEDEERWKAVAQTEPCRRWWAYMGDVMPSNPDNSPVSRDLREVFHME